MEKNDKASDSIIPLYQVDSFTDKVFGGNPAAVCPLEKWIDEGALQSIAMENNVSETAFFVKEGDTFALRWFTPEMEVDLCGHATLASAHVIFNFMEYQRDQITFSTKSGVLKATKKGDLLSMDFPARKPEAAEAPVALVEGLGSTPKEVLKSRDYLAVFEHEKDILAVQPDFNRLMDLDCLGIIITAKGETADFVSRFFAPKVGILEDPVTGSAHCTLIPYWAEKLGKDSLKALQVSKRGGTLYCENKGDRVSISGKAVTYSVGFIRA